MQTMPLNARERTERGTRACRKLRQQGEVPANLYGTTTVDGKTQLSNTNLAVSAYEVAKLIEKNATLFELSQGSKKELVQMVEVQRDAFGDDILHVDLRTVDISKPITSTATLVIKGDAKGVKEGGRLHAELHTIELEALPRDMPRELLVRVDDLGLLEGIHVKDLDLPEGVSAITPPDQMVVQVLPAIEEVEEPPAEGLEPGASPAEPEVISKGKQEEDGEAS